MAKTDAKLPANREKKETSPPSPLDALAEAVESGAGLPATARAASAALAADVALIDGTF